ncbi:hypothetical protein As57867_015202, partial [Aphanomyces stellatus]
VCFDTFTPTGGVTKLCGPACPAQVCASCLTQCIRTRIQSIPAGILTKLDCPICIRPVNLMRWKMRCPASVRSEVDTFALHIQHACDVLCPNCHCTSNVLPKHSTTVDPIKLMPSLAKYIPALRQLCQEYCRHRVSVQDLCAFVQTTFPRHFDLLCRRMLSLIHDVERRATLFLRIARAQPFIKSACCQADLCFNCKTCGHHNGTPCSVLDNSTEAMGSCPNCNLTLVKGDGCDWITCFCGRGFYWTHGLCCFRWSLVTSHQKRLVLVAIVWPALHSFRMRKVILPELVLQVNLRPFTPRFRLVLAYLRGQVVKNKEKRKLEADLLEVLAIDVCFYDMLELVRHHCC